MTELERNNLLTYVENYRKALPEYAQKHWEDWCKKRNIVASKLNLNNDQILYLTKRQMVDLVVVVLKERSGFNRVGATKFSKTKGTTKIIKKMTELIDVRSSIERAMPVTVKRFDTEIDKLNKKSR